MFGGAPRIGYSAPMRTLSVELPETDADRLADLAAREGVTPEQAAAAAVRARLEQDLAARQDVEAGLAELDAGKAMTLEAYEREMDAFMASLALSRG